VTIRPSTDGDVAAMAEIYAYHVLHGTATFEIEPPGIAEMARRRSELERKSLPWIVAEIDHELVGYAYAGFHRARMAYRFTVEDSIYIHPSYLNQGFGGMLLRALIETCQERGFHQMIAVIGGSDNIASVRLHERYGFRHVGVLRAVGFKFGNWVDTVLMQRSL
jgi:L-amino acid N-acyltransferase YncA